MLHLNVTKRLRHFPVSVNLSLGADITVLLGPSGHGKTTFLNMIAGITVPDKGHVSLDGVTLFDSRGRTNVSMERRGIGFVFQDYALFPNKTVFENVAYGLRARGVSGLDIAERVAQELTRLQIRELRDAKPAQLSGGQRQRVALARTLVTRPRIMLLDEPLSALDVQLRSKVRGELRALLKQLAVPSVIVTHDPLDAVGLADDVLVMEGGQIIQRGSYESLLAAPRSTFVADFVESNALSGQLESFCEDGESAIRISPTAVIYANTALADERQTVVIHPWDISLSRSPIQSSIRNMLPAKVIGICPLRDRVRVLLDIGVSLTAEISSASLNLLGITVGTEVYASFKTTAVKTFCPH
jgi:molybdate transport system ATP-binding protein